MQQILAQLLIHPDHKSFSLTGSILRYKSRLYIGSGKQIRTSIMHSMHASSVVSDHSGMWGTYTRDKSYFYWPKMKPDIIHFVSTCDTCQCNKHEHSAPAGLLQPLPIPGTAWKHISMDFIEGLPLSNKKSVILVVVDRVTKYSHFISLSHPFTALSVAKEFLHHIFKIHGLPSSIVLDRNKKIIIHFWRELFKSFGTTLNLSTLILY